MTKRILSLVLAMVMMACLATTAFAANVVNETTHVYKAYQIFSGTQDETSANLGNAKWGSGVDAVNLIKALKAANPELYGSLTELAAGYTEEESMDSVKEVSAALVADNTAGADYHKDAEEFAKIAVGYIKGDGIALGESGEVSMPAGYYLIVDVTPATDLGEDGAKNPALLQVTNKGNVYIAEKFDIPTHDKNILHTDENGETERIKVDEHAIGDVVHFELVGTTAENMADYVQYKVVFHDAMSKGLTFQPDTVVVYVDGVKLDKNQGYSVVLGENCGYTHKDGEKCTFTVKFDDVLAAPVDDDGAAIVQGGSQIVVLYDAIINEDAEIDVANPNDSALEFSNDPNWRPGGSVQVPPTGITPWKEVEVYTTKIGLFKVDGMTMKRLQGAEFTLTGESTNVVIASYSEFVAAEEGYAGTKYWLLTDGTYSTTDPNGEGIDQSKYADLTTIYKEVVHKDVKNTKGSSPVVAKAFVGSDGYVSFQGLGVGTYTIVESVTPTSYNTIDPIILTIGFNETTKSFTYSWKWEGSATPFNHTNSITVENYQGKLLPETGGVGTTMFYVGGVALLAAAAFILVSKKRAEEK